MKTEYRHGWIGRLIALLESCPAFEFPSFAFFSDPSEQNNSPVGTLPALRERLNKDKSAFLVHAAGTCSVTCNDPVTQSSPIFPDFVPGMGVPIIPVRFSGGLPTRGSHDQTRLELPLGSTGQDWFIGAPLYPEDLSGIPSKERKERILASIDNLGPPLADERPNRPDEDFSRKVESLGESLGIRPLAATLLAALQADPEGVSLAESLSADDFENGTPSGQWLSDLEQWMGKL
uniref:Uncharacterized protein n=1 Tax=Candidatus Kentrum sp. LFY TaxID=2126342 RepID=A0A450V0A1_9GAMM|nr:MAG: hypothetical protein BECKLFY1418B_GA0070995_11152 [Candidatus Kentron sp. LFY]